MKDIIINKSTNLFLNLGYKSVTMDDIANELGMSKKTIYIYFKNKTCLVEATTSHLFKKITDGIKEIKIKTLDPITELHDIKIFLMNSLKGEKNSPYYQLQKYYPSIHKELKKKKFEFVLDSTKKSLEKGIKQGIFRQKINIELISRLYFNGIIGIRNPEIFPTELFSPSLLMENYSEYHLRAIVTKKGLKKLEKFLLNQLKV
ncbi:TetR/AcrR family transcriptional regulator [Flavobacteriaceae bacterium]|jgi:AcrR family transcriptional regulator|nr:TetR/AcrR family transcriptional regulator [Flavobacteriaceae bacterium]